MVGIAPDAPDYVKRSFLQMTLEYPECRAAIMGKHDGKSCGINVK
jgi:hypothetical protein